MIVFERERGRDTEERESWEGEIERLRNTEIYRDIEGKIFTLRKKYFEVECCY